MLSKGSFTNYQYTHANRPHQVSAVTTPAGTRSYSYDANGNLTQVTGPGARTVSWWSFNKPRRMERDGNNHAEYWYGPGGDRAMFRQSARIDGQTVLTLYGSALYERREAGLTVEHTHHVQANGRTVATVKRSGASTTNTTRYLHKDHLGSVVVITGETGTIVESLAYDAWGKRRPASTWQTPAPGVFIAAITLTRGFTMHEHLDQVGLIHMGGRVYDPEIGRFLSPDPFVQFPISTQGFNRYAYVGNNPLSYTDPSGYFLKKLMKVAGIGMNFIPGWTLAGNAFIHGFVSGFLASGGNAQAGMMGMMSAGIAGKIGGIENLDNVRRSALHGITQGAVSAAGGGRFGDGALGAFSGSLLSFIPEAVAGPYGSQEGQIGRMVAAAAVGGTVSRIGGGKFANGAWSAAFVSRFNHDHAGNDLPTFTLDEIVIDAEMASATFDFYELRGLDPSEINSTDLAFAQGLLVEGLEATYQISLIKFTVMRGVGATRLLPQRLRLAAKTIGRTARGAKLLEATLRRADLDSPYIAEPVRVKIIQNFRSEFLTRRHDGVYPAYSLRTGR
nr:RHS repeat-associated core domain-containing protein [Wenzhouxiangella sp. XN24]